MEGLKACFVAPSPTTSTTSDKSQCRPIRRSRRPRLREGHQCGRCSHPGAMRQSLGSHADTSTGRGWHGAATGGGGTRLACWVDGMGWDGMWDGMGTGYLHAHTRTHTHTHTPHHTRCDVLTYLVDAPSLRLHVAGSTNPSIRTAGLPDRPLATQAPAQDATGRCAPLPPLPVCLLVRPARTVRHGTVGNSGEAGSLYGAKGARQGVSSSPASLHCAAQAGPDSSRMAPACPPAPLLRSSRRFNVPSPARLPCPHGHRARQSPRLTDQAGQCRSRLDTSLLRPSRGRGSGGPWQQHEQEQRIIHPRVRPPPAHKLCPPRLSVGWMPVRGSISSLTRSSGKQMAARGPSPQAGLGWSSVASPPWGRIPGPSPHLTSPQGAHCRIRAAAARLLPLAQPVLRERARAPGRIADGVANRSRVVHPRSSPETGERTTSSGSRSAAGQWCPRRPSQSRPFSPAKAGVTNATSGEREKVCVPACLPASVCVCAHSACARACASDWRGFRTVVCARSLTLSHSAEHERRKQVRHEDRMPPRPAQDKQRAQLRHGQLGSSDSVSWRCDWAQTTAEPLVMGRAHAFASSSRTRSLAGPSGVANPTYLPAWTRYCPLVGSVDANSSFLGLAALTLSTDWPGAGLWLALSSRLHHGKLILSCLSGRRSSHRIERRRRSRFGANSRSAAHDSASSCLHGAFVWAFGQSKIPASRSSGGTRRTTASAHVNGGVEGSLVSMQLLAGARYESEVNDHHGYFAPRLALVLADSSRLRRRGCIFSSVTAAGRPHPRQRLRSHVASRGQIRTTATGLGRHSCEAPVGLCWRRTHINEWRGMCARCIQRRTLVRDSAGRMMSHDARAVGDILGWPRAMARKVGSLAMSQAQGNSVRRPGSPWLGCAQWRAQS
ncbi:hypothetical protein Purlil1_10967 [Purpureocillium lilacinum]|uniref:Uncharacterized protein n=1 Tax=Purpureocillium lilacinum TaxID=33203 RepID=A0ABR0BL66_PURLI|nr:hypothetical protein Purlil1_10967 [Purpureocillium lilacinum]